MLKGFFPRVRTEIVIGQKAAEFFDAFGKGRLHRFADFLVEKFSGGR
jgi:hypothetical protein